MNIPLAVKSGRSTGEFKELFLSGVSLREIAYVFRARFRGRYIILFDVDSGSFLEPDLAARVNAEGALCDQLTETGDVCLLSSDSFDLLAELGPLRARMLFVDGPLTPEDYRRLSIDVIPYPEQLDKIELLHGRLFLDWNAAGQLMLAGRDDWFPRDILEYFFEKSFLDNQRMLRSDELDELLRVFMCHIDDTGLLVQRRDERDRWNDAPVRAIGWAEPLLLGNCTWSAFGGSVNLFEIKRGAGRLEIGTGGRVSLLEFLGPGTWFTYMARCLRARVAPFLTTLCMALIIVELVSPSGGRSSLILVLVVLLLMLNILAGTDGL